MIGWVNLGILTYVAIVVTALALARAPARRDEAAPRLSSPDRHASRGSAEVGRLRAGVLRLTSLEKVPSGQLVTVVVRPSGHAFRPDRIIIETNPGDWVINDVRIGDRSQFSQPGTIPGEVFASAATDSFVSFETVQTAMDFAMDVIYVGAREGGAAFAGLVIGLEAS